MLGKELRVEYVAYDDQCNAIDIVERCGLLPVDAIHVAVALRIKAKSYSYLRRRLQGD